MNTSTRAIIRGRVQGVGYRAWTVSTASKLQLKGWVRNRSDGTVEAVFHGNDDQLASMLAACKKGPLLARVDAIETFVFEEALTEETFTAKPTV
jgi:acylphosphatase